MYRVRQVKENNKLLRELVQVQHQNQIELEYYHRTFDKRFFIYHLDEYSSKDIQKFINKGLIFIKKAT